jgi:large-conductance mechanosensitive channel
MFCYTLNCGMFNRAVIDSLIVAWAVFLMIKGMHTLRRKQETPEGKS